MSIEGINIRRSPLKADSPERKISLGANLKNYRQTHNLTLDMVSELTGVSKSMLSEIERGIKNPTINVLDKINEGLNISLLDTSMNLGKRVHLDIGDKQTSFYTRKGVDEWVLFENDPENRFRMVQFRFQKGAVMDGQISQTEVWEYCFVMQGQITFTVNGESVCLQEGEMLWFPSNLPHRYTNSYAGESQFFMMVHV